MLRLPPSAARVLALVLLTACGDPRPNAAPAVAAPAVVRAAEVLPPCTATVAGVDVAAWHEVQDAGFRLCVPGTWTRAASRDTSGTADGRWRAGTERSIAWRVGPFAPGRGNAVPYNEREVRELWFDNRPGQLSILGIQDHHSFHVGYAATATAPALRLSGFARGAAARGELLTIFQTLRGPAAP